MQWFEDFFGFQEDPSRIRDYLTLAIDEEAFTVKKGSRAGSTLRVGKFTTPTVSWLMEEIAANNDGVSNCKATFGNMTADIRAVHSAQAVPTSSSSPPPGHTSG